MANKGSVNKTVPTDVDPADFVASVEPAARREEAEALLRLFTEATGSAPFMYGPTIVAFGAIRYRYPTGREGDWMRVGFSPRKAALSLYGFKDAPGLDDLLERLGPHTEGAGCVYVKRLAHVDEAVLRALVAAAYAAPREHIVTD